MTDSMRDIMLDVLSAVWLIALIVLAWKLPWIGGYRPVKKLFEWMCSYPLLAFFYGLFSLMTWGVVGVQYGVRSLLLADDRLTQFLCGFALIAVFLRLSFQFVVLDRSRRRWFWSLKTCLDVEIALARLRLFGANRSLPVMESAGHSQRMRLDDLRLLVDRDVATGPEGDQVADVLDSGSFRISMAPVILDFYASILFVFLGVVPILPSLADAVSVTATALWKFEYPRLDPNRAETLYRHLDWFVGAMAGVLASKILVRRTVRSFQDSTVRNGYVAGSIADESRRKDSLAILNRAVAASRARGAENLGNAGQNNEIEPGHVEPVHLSVLRNFAVVLSVFHAVFLIFPLFGQDPLKRLGAEALIAAAIVGVLRVSPFLAAKSAVVILLGTAILVSAAILSGVPEFSGRFQTLTYLTLAIVSSIAIQTLALMGKGFRTPRNTFVKVLYGLALGLFVPAITIRLSEALGATGWWTVQGIGLAKYLAAIWIGTLVARWTMALFDPLLSFPVSAIMGFLAFAGFFAELPESCQARVPAAFTVIYFAGFVASCFTCVLHSEFRDRPKRVAFGFVMLILIMGQGWGSDPNQFKLRFPGLDGHSLIPSPPEATRSQVANYYANPVRINSEAYFRVSNRSVIKLHSEVETDFYHAENGVRISSRMASGIIFKDRCAKRDAETISVRFSDERHFSGESGPGKSNDYLRLRPGDPVELIATDMRFDCEFDRSAEDPVLKLVLQARGVDLRRLPYPDPVTVQALFAGSKSLTIKLGDLQEQESGVRLTLERRGDLAAGVWLARVDSVKGEIQAPVVFEQGTISIGGDAARALSEAMRRAGNGFGPRDALVPETEPGWVESALVTANWDLVVESVNVVDEDNRREGVTLRWNLGGGESAPLPESLESPVIEGFLHKTYLVTGVENRLSSDQVDRLLAPVLTDGQGGRISDAGAFPRQLLSFKGIGETQFEPGDCFEFRYSGWESPAKLADLVRLATDATVPDAWKGPLEPFLLEDRTLRAVLDRAPWMIRSEMQARLQGGSAETNLPGAGIASIGAAGNGPGNDTPFSLMRSPSSGVFAFDPLWTKGENGTDGDRIVALYNARQLREGDRILLRWEDGASAAPGESTRKRAAIFEVIGKSLGLNESTGPLPPDGFDVRRLRPIDTRGTQAAVKNRENLAYHDLLPRTSPAKNLAGTWSRLELLDNYEVLQAWKNANGRPDGAKPRLTIVTVSGGGIRSSVWTATVLDELHTKLGPEFSRSIRIITGASGGMVAASDFVGNLTRSGRNTSAAYRPVPAADPRGEDPYARDGYLTRNQLDAVLGQMLFEDIPGAANPFPHRLDRGRTLEETWARIGRDEQGNPSPFERSIREFAAGEAAGWRPTIVYTPMMVEDGRRMLISNLDLSFVTRNLSALLMEDNQRKIKHAAYQVNASDRLLNRADDLLSLSAVEFYRVFPEAWQFSVSTATRMSASFPWVAPAVSLPTIPSRRIVDAGYYDNYGVNLASLWLAEMREWLLENTSGVLLVQIRDHESQRARTDIDFDVEPQKNASSARQSFDDWTFRVLDRDVEPVLHPLMTPVSGVASARSWTMSFRNDEQVELLDELFNDVETEDQAFFRTVVFECPVEASLSWNLSEEEIRQIRAGFGTRDPEPAQLKDADTKEKTERQRMMLESIGIAPQRLAQLKPLKLQELYVNTFGNRRRIHLLQNWWKKSTAASKPSAEPRR